MKKKLSLLIVIGLIVLGGCGMNNEEENVSPSEMNAEDLPDVPAFQDEFTREFLQSTEPVREGFYPFLSKSESFTMDFPEDMVISSRSHNIGPDNDSETIIISSCDDNADVFTEHTIHYYNFMTDEKSNKKAMSNSAGRELDFVEVDTDFNNQSLEIAEFKDQNFHTIASLIWDSNNNKQIQVFTSIDCKEQLDNEYCTNEVEKEKDKIISQIKSIELLEESR